MRFINNSTKLTQFISKPKFKPDEPQFRHSAQIQYFSNFKSIKIMPIYPQHCGNTRISNKCKRHTQTETIVINSKRKRKMAIWC